MYNKSKFLAHVGQYYFVNQLSAFLTANTHFLDILPEMPYHYLYLVSFVPIPSLSFPLTHNFSIERMTPFLCSEIAWKHLLGRLSMLSCILWADMHNFGCLFESQCVAGISFLSTTPFLLLFKGVRILQLIGSSILKINFKLYATGHFA